MIDKTESEIMREWGEYEDNELVTIRCITYNHSKYIEQCLDGLLFQITKFSFHIVIHDDCSTDNTQEIIKQYVAKYPKIITPIYEKENQYSKHDGSIPKIINPYLKGKYVAICEGDDYWIDQYKLQKQITYLQEHANCALTFTSSYYSNNGDLFFSDLKSNKECDFSTDDMIRGGGNFCATASLCFLTQINWKSLR